MIWQHVVLCGSSVARSAPRRCTPSDVRPTQHDMLPHHQIIIRKPSSDVFNNVILARNRQLPDDNRMIETCRSIFKSFNVNHLSVCTGWCADQLISIIYFVTFFNFFLSSIFYGHLALKTCGICQTGETHNPLYLCFVQMIIQESTMIQVTAGQTKLQTIHPNLQDSLDNYTAHSSLCLT